jgi:DNA mismatch repair protein MutH
VAKLTIGLGKSAAAGVLRAYLGVKPKGRSADFQRFGVEIKTVPVDSSGRPVESTSFPTFIHEELAFETWEDSDLLGRLNRILFILIERAKGQPQEEAVVRRAFFWSPSEAELRAIRMEWEQFRDLIVQGHAAHLPKASETVYIHVRPKGRDARDRDLAPGGVDVIRKCFWLNDRYVERIVDEHRGHPR